MLVIMTTTPDKKTAEMIAKTLIEKGLVACAQIQDSITSIYKWQEEINIDNEYRILLKTTDTHFERIENIITNLHPYDVPQIIALPVSKASQSYLQWIEDTVAI